MSRTRYMNLKETKWHGALPCIAKAIKKSTCWLADIVYLGRLELYLLWLLTVWHANERWRLLGCGIHFKRSIRFQRVHAGAWHVTRIYRVFFIPNILIVSTASIFKQVPNLFLVNVMEGTVGFITMLWYDNTRLPRQFVIYVVNTACQNP
ncbi:hypothetical protein KSS87_014094 [Heliosperma pusillum]|nr:hypothetical protein KSS87_014094 [Heliosperma pusillum]